MKNSFKKVIVIIKQAILTVCYAIKIGLIKLYKTIEVFRRGRRNKNAFAQKIGECRLNDEQKEQVKNQYGKYYRFPLKQTDVFHRFYYEKTGVFSEKYLPDDLHYCRIDPFYNNWDEAKILDNKCLYSRLFPGTLQPQTVAGRMNGVWTDASFEMISEEKLLSLISNAGAVVIKEATESEGGHGVHFAEDCSSASEAIKQIQGDIIIQKVIKQHGELNRLNESSVNTIRIISLLSKDKVKIYSSILRMGINGSKVDNASSGGITCGITDKGRLKPIAYATNGTKYDAHPTSKVKFDDIVVPSFDKAKELVLKLHPYIPNFRLISWDIAINEEAEPVLIEANLCYGELDFHQLNNGPLFGEDLDMILEEVFGEKK